MRKFFALAMMALLALTIAFAAVGCGQRTDETSTTTETTPPVETSMPDTGMMSDTTVMDTLMQH